MEGVLETLLNVFLIPGFSSALAVMLMATPPKKVARAQLKKIYVLNEMGDMVGEYILDPDCPIDYNDFLKVLPEEGIGDREALFVGEYVFTAFQSGKFVFVLLSRGQLAPEDFDWTALLLTAADSHLARAEGRPAPVRPSEASGEDEREARIDAKEKELASLEARLKADEANLRGRAEELDRQKSRLTALADYSAQLQQAYIQGLSRALKSLEVAGDLAAAAQVEGSREGSRVLAEARRQFEEERKALLAIKEDLEGKYRAATERVRELEAHLKEAKDALERERQETAAREAEQERMRAAIEARVQELSQRFAQMARDHLMASHRPSGTSTEAEKQAIELEKAELAKERKFLQRRAIEVLDREERVRDREEKLEVREKALAQREAEIASIREELERARTQTATLQARATALDETRKDIEDRIKIIQQKALELLDREEKLRKRAAELEALEARLSGKLPAK